MAIASIIFNQRGFGGGVQAGFRFRYSRTRVGSVKVGLCGGFDFVAPARAIGDVDLRQLVYRFIQVVIVHFNHVKRPFLWQIVFTILPRARALYTLTAHSVNDIVARIY
jgi:hypothetical protein